MEGTQVYEYNSASIEFEVIDEHVMANATLMCQAFGKRPGDWLTLISTKRYIEAVTRKSGNADIQLVTTKGGAGQQGTWIHEKLILKLAQWLDVDFEVWCDEKVAELLRTDSTPVKPLTPAEMFLQNAQVMVEHERRIGVIEQKQEVTETKVAELEAKIVTRPDYFTVVGYASLIKVEVGTEKAKAYGMMASRLCRERGIEVEKVTDTRYGTVGSYPKYILVEVFRRAA